MKRRSILLLAGPAGFLALVLGGCGFKLRGRQNFAFESIAINPSPGGALAVELRRSFGDSVHVVPPGQPSSAAQVVLDILREQRDKIVVGLSSSGQVREFQLRIRVTFRVRTSKGQELVPESEIIQQRDISFNESAVLAKETEEALLYRHMQSDIVQQILRRLATIQ